jgi:DNA-binding transcriptional LysR family regulator
MADMHAFCMLVEFGPAATAAQLNLSGSNASRRMARK